MGRLIKSHLARLIVMTAATYHIAAAIEAFFWPKIFWDFLTKNLDLAVRPFPILQIINLMFGIVILAWEWPFGFLAGSVYCSIKARLLVLPIAGLAASFLYQGANPAMYYFTGMCVYFWGYNEKDILVEPLVL